MALVLPAAALAAAPSTSTDQPTITGASSATLNGIIFSTGGLDTTYNFDYALSSSTYCTSSGTSGTPTSTPTQSLTAASGGADVSADVPGLTQGAQYCYQLIASNTDGPSNGGLVTFTSGAPSAETDNATVTGAQTANISGLADAAGQTGATVAVAYDVSSSTWCTSSGASGSPTNTTGAQTFNQADAQFHSVTLPVTGLTAGTNYCAAIEIKNPTTTTISAPVSFTAGAPFVDTTNAQATSATAAQISGDVDPSGQSGVTYQADYALTTDTWCTSGGTAGTPTNTTPATLGASDTAFHSVTVNLTGLTAGSSYCVEIVAKAGGVSNVGAIGDGDGQTQFTSGVPTADTTGAQGTGPTSGAVTGDVNPSGQTTQYFADYALATDPWCTSGGASGTPSSTSPASLGFTDSTSHQVTVPIGSLTTNSQYCAEIVATNGSGSNLSAINNSDFQFTFTPGGPTVDTFGVQVTSPTTATVSGDVNPNGGATNYFADYGLQSSAWCRSGGASGTPTSTAPVSIGSGTAPQSVTVNLTGLTTGDAYCVAIAATNPSGTTVGTPPRNFTEVLLPIVSTGTTTATGATTETLTGGVNPNGSATTYQFRYALTSDAWCTSGGSSGTPTSTTATSAGSGTSDVSVSANLSGLTPGGAYCWQLSATNSGGTATSGNSTTFTAGLPSATTNAATGVTGTGATLNGTVNPEGNSTEFRFDYDVQTSTWCQSNGTAGSPAHSTSETPVGAVDTSPHAVSAPTNVSLSTGTAYCFEVVASNAAGDATGSTLTFTTTTPPGAPVVSTGAASGVTTSAATLNGTVNPKASATTYHFEYGTTTGYGGNTPTASAGSGNSPVAVSATVTGLAPDTTYHFRLDATNTVSTTDGPDQTFTTGTVVTTETLTVTTAGTGSGKVTSSPGGISCPGTCLASYPQGTVVFLTATPASGSSFAGWSGACSGTGSCAVPLDPNQAVTATFTKNPPPKPKPSCSLQLASSKVLLKKHNKGPLKKVQPGTVTLTAVCNQSANAVIAGKLTAKGKKPKHGKAKTTSYTFSVSTPLSANAAKSIVVSLPTAAVSALSKGATETVVFTLTGANANGAGAASASGRLKSQK